MSDASPSHPHSHGHAPHNRHGRTPRLRASWLRHSAVQRLAVAGAAIALLWAAVYWALQ